MKTVNIQVSIQMDIKGKNILQEVLDILDTVNAIISQSELDAQPQIFTTDLSNSDIFEI